MALDPYTLQQAEEDIATLRGQVDLLTEILAQSDSGTQPNTPSAGYLLYNAGGVPSYVNAAGLQMGLQGAQLATFPNTVVTAASLTNIASATYPAGDAEVGSIYDLEVWGNGSQGSTNQTLEFSVALGGAAMQNFTIGAGMFGTTGLAFRWHMTARVICVTTGASGTWKSLIFGELSGTGNLIPSNSSNPTGAFIQCEQTSTTTKDTTVNQTLSLQCAWGATTGGPSITSRISMFKRIA